MTQLAMDMGSAPVGVRRRVVTDIYPTRYTAFDNEGAWAVFQPTAEGTYRRCVEDARPSPIGDLRSAVSAPGEAAILYAPEPNPHHPGLWSGVSVEVFGAPGHGYWASCHRTRPDAARSQQNHNGPKRTTLEEAIADAEAWIAEVTS